MAKTEEKKPEPKVVEKTTAVDDDAEKRDRAKRRAERAAEKQAEKDADPNEYGYGRGY